MADEKNAAEIVMLPEGRLINHSLFTRDIYTNPQGQQGAALYKAEIAWPKGTLDLISNKMLDFANAKWGAGAEDDVILPIKDGDVMAKARAKDGKDGDAYAGQEVLRMNTKYNKFGDDGPGGISVFGPDGETEIGVVNSSEVYQGCYVIAGVTFSGYQVEDARTKTKLNAITLYLVAVQKTNDGERLVAQIDRSKLFKPVGRPPVEEGEGEGGATPSRNQRKG